MKRIISVLAVILAMVTVLASFAACAGEVETTVNDETDPVAVDDTTVSSEETKPDETEPEVEYTLLKLDFETELSLADYIAATEGIAINDTLNGGEIKDGKTVPFGVKIAIWVTCALLYVTQVSGVFYRLVNSTKDNAFVFIGAAIMVLGLVIESVADIQKNNAKKVNPRRFVDTGLYRLVRCPNYLGEMIFWTGVLVSGIGAVTGCTYPEQFHLIHEKMPNGFFLIPGYGAQGGTGKDIAEIFKDDICGVVNSSRGVIGAARGKTEGEDFIEYIRKAAKAVNEDIAQWL